MTDLGLNPPVPIVLVASCDPVLREAAVDGLLSDIPGAVALCHDLRVDEGMLHRTIYDCRSVIEDVWVSLEHACLSCAMREDVLPTLERLVLTRRPRALLLGLPVTAEPLPLMAALTALPAVRVAGIAAVFDPHTLEADLFGDDLLVERDLAFTATDRRAVGEALVHQVEAADMLLVPDAAPQRAAAVLDHLVEPSVGRHLMHSVDGRVLVAHHRSPSAGSRGDLLRVAATGAESREGVWTLDLQSWRPLHPQRLLDNIETLGTGRLRGRGHFWLPTRPEVIGGWDGAGGQLSIGDHGRWSGRPATHLLITGADSDPAPLLKAFEAALMDDTELAGGLARWDGRADGLDPWFGGRRGAA